MRPWSGWDEDDRDAPGDSDHGHDGGESEAGDDQATAGAAGPDPSGPGLEADQRREEC